MISALNEICLKVNENQSDAMLVRLIWSKFQNVQNKLDSLLKALSIEIPYVAT